MPNPKNYDNEKEWMAACVPTRIDEGDKRDRAVAACLSMWKNKERGEGQGVGGERQGDGGADKCVCPECGATAEHEKGTPCSEISCPECGAKMEGEQDKAISLWNMIKEFFAKEKVEEPEERKETNTFTVWKDTDTGQYRWIAVYSNKWRDEDNPPEILASKAHQDFVDAVDKGDWPQPEAWLWHVPGTRFGVADFVAYDDLGFALASGTVDKEQEHIAEFLSTQEDLAMSHGMPVKEIERDENDPTIITRYRTIEISPLPRRAAANKYGTAIELIREVKMAIPENKRAFLADAMGEKGLESLEEKLADKAKELDELEIQSKEETLEEESEEEAAEEAEPVEEPVEEESKEEAPEEETPEYVTASDVAAAVGAYLKPLIERLDKLDAIESAVAEQGKSIKELQKGTEEKVKETIAMTPAASLFEQIGSVIGSDETYVDGRKKLAKAGPEENEDPARDGPARVGLVNELMDQAWSKRQ